MKKFVTTCPEPFLKSLLEFSTSNLSPLPADKNENFGKHGKQSAAQFSIGRKKSVENGKITARSIRILELEKFILENLTF